MRAFLYSTTIPTILSTILAILPASNSIFINLFQSISQLIYQCNLHKSIARISNTDLQKTIELI
jgi:hypothetical protein